MSDAIDQARLGPYSAVVRRYFDQPAHAGDIGPVGRNILTARASDPASGADVLLTLAIDGPSIRAMRYRVFGCPHLIAALEYCCERFEGADIGSLAKFSLGGVMKSLDVPVEKTVRMLLIEDVIRSVREQAERAGDGNGH